MVTPRLEKGKYKEVYEEGSEPRREIDPWRTYHDGLRKYHCDCDWCREMRRVGKCDKIRKHIAIRKARKDLKRRRHSR